MTSWVAALLLVLGLVAPAVASPRLELAARDGRVTVFAEPGLGDTAEELAARAEDALDQIGDDLAGLPAPRSVEIRLVRDASDLAAIAPGGRGAPPWAVGMAYPDAGVVSIAIRSGATYPEPIETLRHELAHLALGAALAARAPRWLHEGFAYQHSAEWSRERIETLAGMAWLGGIIPIDELDRSFPRDEQVAHRAYAEAYDFVGFLAHRGRWEDGTDAGDRYPFRRFLRELAHGASLDVAAIRAYGRPLRALFEEWQRDLTTRYQLIPVGLLGLALWIGVALLVVLAWLRRRRLNRRRIAQWELEDAARAEQRTRVVAPPYIPWPGEDPFDDDPDDRGDEPRLMN